MGFKRKLPWLLTGKSLLAVGSISLVALALVTYTATVTVQFNAFFKTGLTSITWFTTTSTGFRYLPGNNTLPGAPVSTTPSTFAYLTQIGQGYVQVNLAAPVLTTDYQAFRIFVLVYNATWNNATMWTTSTGTTAVSGGIDGTSSTCTVPANCNLGFIRVHGTTLTMYAIEVSYTLAASPQNSATYSFDYTPSLT